MLFNTASLCGIQSSPATIRVASGHLYIALLNSVLPCRPHSFSANLTDAPPLCHAVCLKLLRCVARRLQNFGAHSSPMHPCIVTCHPYVVFFSSLSVFPCDETGRRTWQGSDIGQRRFAQRHSCVTIFRPVSPCVYFSVHLQPTMLPHITSVSHSLVLYSAMCPIVALRPLLCPTFFIRRSAF